MTTRRVARKNPHLYDLMFGLSTVARPTDRCRIRTFASVDVHRPSKAPTFTSRSVRTAREPGRVRQQEPEALAAQLWSFVHGCITLELAEHFVEFDDPVAQVLLPMGVNLAVGLGNKRESAQSSHEAGARLYDSITRQ